MNSFLRSLSRSVILKYSSEETKLIFSTNNGIMTFTLGSLCICFQSLGVSYSWVISRFNSLSLNDSCGGASLRWCFFSESVL